MRVVSLDPSSTELLFAAGGGNLLVGGSHARDWPPPSQVSALLIALQPDVILMLDGGDVGGGVGGGAGGDAGGVEVRALQAAVEAAIVSMHPKPRIITRKPTTLWQVLDDLLTMGEAIGQLPSAELAMTRLRDRIWTAAEQTSPYTDGASVLFLERIEPLTVSGRWIPELITLAGGRHPLNSAGAASRVVSPQEIAQSAPDRVIVCPRGMSLSEVRTAMSALEAMTWWHELPAVRAAGAMVVAGAAGVANAADSAEVADGFPPVMLVDGAQAFHRPGPRLVDALEWLTGWLNARPGLAPREFPCAPWQPSRSAPA